MLHNELMADNRYVCKNGHLCKDLIEEEAGCIRLMYLLKKLFLLYVGVIGAKAFTIDNHDWYALLCTVHIYVESTENGDRRQLT